MTNNPSPQQQVSEILMAESNRLAVLLDDKTFVPNTPHVIVGVRREMQRLRQLAVWSASLQDAVCGRPPAPEQIAGTRI